MNTWHVFFGQRVNKIVKEMTGKCKLLEQELNAVVHEMTAWLNDFLKICQAYFFKLTWIYDMPSIHTQVQRGAWGLWWHLKIDAFYIRK